MKTAAWNGKHGYNSFWERNILGFDVCRKRISLGEKGEVVPCRRTENRKRHGHQLWRFVEPGARNLKAESIRITAESTGGCVKLKTVTEMEQCARYIYGRECLSCAEFSVGLGASGDTETEE